MGNRMGRRSGNEIVREMVQREKEAIRVNVHTLSLLLFLALLPGSHTSTCHRGAGDRCTVKIQQLVTLHNQNLHSV